MARQSKPNYTPPSVSPSKGCELLNNRILKGNELLERRFVTHSDYEVWSSMVEDTIEQVFGCPSDKYATFYAPEKRRDMSPYQASVSGFNENDWNVRRADT